MRMRTQRILGWGGGGGGISVWPSLESSINKNPDSLLEGAEKDVCLW